MSLFLIVNADDLGMTPGVTTGILEAHRHGILTSASLMVNSPWLDEVVAALKDYPQISIGLHFNLTHGRPTAPAEEVSSLLQPWGSDGLPSQQRRATPANSPPLVGGAGGGGDLRFFAPTN